MDIVNKVSTPGITLILTMVFGFWLSNAGKPYNSILFNLHKLIALGTVILIGMQVARLPRTTDALTLIIVLLVVAAICVVALFASGALMSAGKLDYTLMLTIHRIAPVVLTITLALVAYLLWRKI
jgi:hypothetical protein